MLVILTGFVITKILVFLKIFFAFAQKNKRSLISGESQDSPGRAREIPGKNLAKVWDFLEQSFA